MSGPGLVLLMATALVLPGPDTESRDRSFCRRWLELSRADKQAVMTAADAAERGWSAACRPSRHASLVHTLDHECRSWPKLMDFEVRGIIDRILEPCREPAASSGSPGDGRQPSELQFSCISR